MEDRDERQLQERFLSPENSSSHRCWRCQSIVRSDLLRRRVVNTSSSRGVHLVTGATVSILGRYEIVDLCAACATELTAEKQAKIDARAYSEAWWGRLGMGVCFVALMLFIRQPVIMGVALAWILDWLRVLGRVVVLMGAVFLVEYFLGMRPHRLRGRLLVPWALIIGGVTLWKLWSADMLPWPLSRLARKGSAASETPTHGDGLSLSSETRERS